MIHLFLGTNKKKALTALSTEGSKRSSTALRLTDTSPAADLRAAFEQGGMFSEKRTVILDRLSDNEELWTLLVNALPRLAESPDDFFIYEEKPLAAMKRLLEKNAADTRTFDPPKSGKERPTVFGLIDHMRAGDKKKLWVAYQEELAIGNAPEAINGVLFWGAKQALLSARDAKSVERSKRWVVSLTELPHESRRRGEELEYALERFILSSV